MKNLIIRPRLVPKSTANGQPTANDAAEIGALYRRARVSKVEGVKFLLEAGARLHAKKSELPHGAWYPWLTANADVLGFKDPSIASRLMRAAKSCAGARFENETQALEVCRTIWGHDQLSDDDKIREVIDIRRERYAETYDKKIQNLLRISQGNSELPTDKTYPVLLVDPPWDFCKGIKTTANRSMDNHYPCMSLEEIMALPVSKLATDAAVLFLWTTSAHLAIAMQVIQAWGFAYKSHLVWVKQSIGMGFYFRNKHETLLVAARGEMPAPLPSNRPASLIRAPRGKHSEKPAFVHKLIERMYPDLPKIELFARVPVPGWASWGNQAPASVMSEAAE
jgi:N6-adenosine-specific RNA methylase IME4